MELIHKYFAELTHQQIDQFAALENLYHDWNSKINVISRKDIAHLYLKHILYSLSIAAVSELADNQQVLDIGCGGGFPGVPLAILYPSVQFYLVDSIAKKIKVVDAICQSANIKNIATAHTRVENINDRKFDFAFCRAVAPLKDLWCWSAPLLRKGNRATLCNGLICLKGGDLHQEISDSNVSPKMIEVYDIFQEDYFKEKFLLHVPK